MHIHTPLGLLPEVLQHITIYLSLGDRKTCARVCQAWYNFFQPTVWERFHTHRRHGSQPAQVQEVLAKHARWIKHLKHTDVKFPMEIHQTLREECRSLTTLNVKVLDDHEWMPYRSLIQLNKGLVDIELGGGACGSDFILRERWLHRLVEDHPRLRRLMLSIETVVTVSTLERVVAACPSLTELIVLGSLELPKDTYLYGVQDDDDGFSVAPNTTYRLRMLTVREWNDPAVIQFVERCQSLQGLTIGDWSVVIREELCRLIRSGRFPHLCELVSGAWDFEDGLVLDAAQACRLVKVHILGTDAEMRILVTSQCQTLEELSLTRVSDGSPGMIPEILASCRRLKHLQVYSRGLLNILPLLSKPWVCRDLEVLDIGLGLESFVDESSLPPATAALIQKEKDEEGQGTRTLPRTVNELVEMAFWRRLGELHRLRKLDCPGLFCGRQVDFGPMKCLSWSLDNGLSRLAGLGRMEQLALVAIPPIQIGVAELQFMKCYWPRLQLMMVSELDSDEVQEWLSEHWPDLRFIHHGARFRRNF